MSSGIDPELFETEKAKNLETENELYEYLIKKRQGW